MTNDQDDQPGQSCPDDRSPADDRLAVDVVVFTCWAGVPALLVVERAKEPFADALALPGGFVWPRESTRDAAARELVEETGVEIGPGRLHRLGRYDEAERDPRGVVVSVAYYGYALGAPAVTSGSDARAARWVTVDEFLDPQSKVAFDHRTIVANAVERSAGQRRAPYSDRLPW